LNWLLRHLENMKCKHCKIPFKPTEFLQKHCKQTDDCKVAFGLYVIEKKKKMPKTQSHPDVYSKENKAALASEVQKLARMIDARFGFVTCIDCGKPFGKQIDGGHFNSKGSNMSIAYNLHNLHSQMSNCNQNGLGGGKQMGYYDGLIARYGQDYADYVKYELQQKYQYVGLKNHEIPDILKRTRALIRNFDAYNFFNSVHARDTCNTIIGIYKP